MTLPCLILAAGFGTRMGALTAERPKPLIEVAGRSLLDHALDAAEGAQRVTVNTHYRASQIKAHLKGQDIHIQDESTQILDSGGSVKVAAQRFPKGPMATLNADNVWTGNRPIAELWQAFDPTRMDALLLLVPRDKAIARVEGGDFAMAPNGQLTLDKAAGEFVFTGAQILDPSACLSDPRDVFSLRDIWQMYEAKGRLYGLVHLGQWADVGHPAGIAQAEEMLRGADV